MGEEKRTGIWSFLRLRRKRKEQREPLMVTGRMRWRSFWKHFAMGLFLMILWGTVSAFVVESIRPGTTQYYFTGDRVLAVIECTGGFLAEYLSDTFCKYLPLVLSVFNGRNPLPSTTLGQVLLLSYYHIPQVIAAVLTCLLFVLLYVFFSRKSHRINSNNIFLFCTIIIVNTVVSLSISIVQDWKHNYTALHKAAETSKLGDLRKLVMSGADVNAVYYRPDTQASYTPLRYAVMQNNIDTVGYLLDHGAVDSPSDPRCMSILYDAIGSSTRTTVLKMLLNHGANPNRDNMKGIPLWIGCPLCFATEYGHFEQIQLLVENGADVNDNTHDMTPLQTAVESGKYDIARYLIDKGAKIETLVDPSFLSFKIKKDPNHMTFFRQLGINITAATPSEIIDSASSINNATP